MLKEGRARTSLAREVGRALQMLARAARARHLYRSNNAVLKKMMADLQVAMAAVLQEEGEISIRVRSEAFVFENEIVLEEPNPDESIPFAFYRDGIRRLDLAEGIEPNELEVLVAATAEGFAHSGLGDDIVSFLWRHELEHIRYMVVDTTIVDAARAQAGGELDAFDLDEQIESLLRSIYGTSATDVVGPRAVRVDGSEIAAKEIVESLDVLDEMAPGFHPARVANIEPPSYSNALRAEVEAIIDEELVRRVVAEGCDALVRGIEGEDAAVINDTVLKMYDAALVAGSWYTAAWIIRRVRKLAEIEQTNAMAAQWLAEAVGEARLRQVTTALSSAESDDIAHAIASMFEACGPTVVPTVLSLVPSIAEPTRRRMLVDVAVKVGIVDLEQIRALMTNEQAFVAVEAVHLLAQLGTEDAIDLLASAQGHLQSPVRLALLENANQIPVDRRVLMAVQMLEDPETEVRIRAAHLLGEMREIHAVRAIESRVKDPKFALEPIQVKHAFLSAFVSLLGARALPTLAKLFQDGGGLLAKKDAEEMAVVAAQGLSLIGTPGAVTALKKAATFLNPRVRAAANEALKSLRRPREDG